MSAQFSLAATCWMSDSEIGICPQPNPGSQPLDGNTSKPRHETSISNPAKLSHHAGIVRRLGHLRSARIGESFHLSLRLLSLHFQTLLEHLLLNHQLLTELLELLKHLCQLFSRHTAQSSESLYPHVSTPNPEQTTTENHSTATKTTGTVILKWLERIKTQPHDDRDNCFLPFDSKGAPAV